MLDFEPCLFLGTVVTNDQGGSAVGLPEVDVRLALPQRKGNARIIEVRRTGSGYKILLTGRR